MINNKINGRLIKTFNSIIINHFFDQKNSIKVLEKKIIQIL